MERIAWTRVVVRNTMHMSRMKMHASAATSEEAEETLEAVLPLDELELEPAR